MKLFIYVDKYYADTLSDCTNSSRYITPLTFPCEDNTMYPNCYSVLNSLKKIGFINSISNKFKAMD